MASIREMVLAACFFRLASGLSAAVRRNEALPEGAPGEGGGRFPPSLSNGRLTSPLEPTASTYRRPLRPSPTRSATAAGKLIKSARKGRLPTRRAIRSTSLADVTAHRRPPRLAGGSGGSIGANSSSVTTR